MLKIKEKIWRKYSKKTGGYTNIVSVFEKYKIGRVSTSDKGYTTIEIVGPKQTFVLVSTSKPLKKLSPPLNDGDNAIVKEMPLFFVTTNKMSYYGSAVTKIQGATHFALDGDELIAYKTSGRGLVEEL